MSWREASNLKLLKEDSVQMILSLLPDDEWKSTVGGTAKQSRADYKAACSKIGILVLDDAIHLADFTVPALNAGKSDVNDTFRAAVKKLADEIRSGKNSVVHCRGASPSAPPCSFLLAADVAAFPRRLDRKSTRLNSSHT